MMTSSMEREQRVLPFKDPESTIGLSAHSTVYKYDQPPVVLKITNPETNREYTNTEEALENARSSSAVEIEVRRSLSEQGVNPEVLPLSRYIVHSGQDRKIYVARVQKRIPDAKTLNESGKAVLDMSDAALQTLRGIFQTNLSLWRQERKVFDLMGSSSVPQTIPRRIMNQVFPLFSSRNLISEGDRQIYFIDSTHYVKPSIKEDFPRWIGMPVRVAGTVISLGLINRELRKRQRSKAKGR